MNNVGFRQYILPNNVTINQTITINDKSYLKDQTKLEYAVTNTELNACCIQPKNTKSIKDAQIIIKFEKEYRCNLVQIIFKNLVNKVKIYDYSNKERGSLILDQQTAATNSKQVIDKNLSAILITDFQLAEDETDIQIQNINVFSNEIIPPTGYYIKDIEIHSKESEE